MYVVVVKRSNVTLFSKKKYRYETKILTALNLFSKRLKLEETAVKQAVILLNEFYLSETERNFYLNVHSKMFSQTLSRYSKQNYAYQCLEVLPLNLLI